jgi:hypothetical protein
MDRLIIFISLLNLFISAYITNVKTNKSAMFLDIEVIQMNQSESPPIKKAGKNSNDHYFICTD